MIALSVDLPLESGSRLDLFRDMFLFACYAGGLRISDLLFLRRSSYKNGAISYRMKKTKTLVQNQPIATLAQKIAQKYKDRTTDNLVWLFPLLKLEKYPDNEKELHFQLTSKTAMYNTGLKELSKLAGFDEIKLTSHIARHSFATLMLTKEQKIEVVSSILKHSNIRETQIYARIISTQERNAMEML